MSELHLKHCPFCGGDAVLTYDGPVSDRTSYVKCKSCDSSTKKIPISTKYSSDERAVEAWNKRVDTVLENYIYREEK